MQHLGEYDLLEKLGESVLSDDGRQVPLRPAEFATTYGWKNDPGKIRPGVAAAADRLNGGKVPMTARGRDGRRSYWLGRLFFGVMVS